ncbi:MAG TPA: CopG family transcriptional regulator [Candidatus Tectomicrobia bacterium]
MTPAEEARFIALWQEGLTCPDIAHRLGIPAGTARSRAYSLQQQGKIPRRPQGGRRVQARADGSPRPVQRPVQSLDTGAVHSADTGAVQTFDTGPVQRLDRLEDEVLGLRHLVQSVLDRLDHRPVQTPVQITTLPPYPQGKAVRWNLWILDAIRDKLAALATERGISPSQLVQELLWKALSRE